MSAGICIYQQHTYGQPCLRIRRRPACDPCIQLYTPKHCRGQPALRPRGAPERFFAADCNRCMQCDDIHSISGQCFAQRMCRAVYACDAYAAQACACTVGSLAGAEPYAAHRYACGNTSGVLRRLLHCVPLFYAVIRPAVSRYRIYILRYGNAAGRDYSPLPKTA